MSNPFENNYPVGTWDPAYYALIAAPGNHILLADRPDFRVMEVIIRPGEIEPAHHHAGHSVMAVMAATAIRIWDHANQIAIDVPAREASEMFPIVQDMEPEDITQIQNRDPDRTYRAVRLEYKTAQP